MWERPVLDGENVKQCWEQLLIVGHQDESHSWINVSDVNRKCKYKQSGIDCEHESERVYPASEMLPRIKDEMSTRIDMEKPYCCSPWLVFLLLALIHFLMALQSKSALFSQHLSVSCCLYFSLWHTTQIPNPDGSKGTKGLPSHRRPSQTAPLLGFHRSDWRTPNPLQSSDGHRDGAVPAYTAAEVKRLTDTRLSIRSESVWKMHSRCKKLTAAHICHRSHLPSLK